MYHEVKLKYGKGPDGRSRYIMDVANGLECQCMCPACGARLVAKNQGSNMQPHFAHFSGQACTTAHESELHLLAKEIIEEEKAVMLPAYGKVFGGGTQRFAEVEVETRRDDSMLQPDLVGIQYHPVTSAPARLWIEIRVTHEVGPEKYQRIKELNIPCLEIDLSLFRQAEAERSSLRDFLLHSQQHRQWIHNPTLQQKQEAINQQRRNYAEQLRQSASQVTADSAKLPHSTQQAERAAETDIVESSKCLTCRKHSTRMAILEETVMQKFPAEYRQILMRHPLNWLQSALISPFPARPTDYVVTIGRDTLYLPTSSPDAYGREVTPLRMKQNHRAITFFSHTLPDMMQRLGTRCDHIVRYKEIEPGKLGVKCRQRQNPLIPNKEQ